MNVPGHDTLLKYNAVFILYLSTPFAGQICSWADQVCIELNQMRVTSDKIHKNVKSNMQFINLAFQNVNANSQDANSNLENIKPFVQTIKSNLHEIKTNPLFIKSNSQLVNKIEIEHEAIAVKLDPMSVMRLTTNC